MCNKLTSVGHITYDSYKYLICYKYHTDVLNTVVDILHVLHDISVKLKTPPTSVKLTPSIEPA